MIKIINNKPAIHLYSLKSHEHKNWFGEVCLVGNKIILKWESGTIENNPNMHNVRHLINAGKWYVI